MIAVIVESEVLKAGTVGAPQTRPRCTYKLIIHGKIVVMVFMRRHHAANFIKYWLRAFEQLKIAHIANGLSRQVIRTLPVLGITLIEYGERGQISIVDAVKYSYEMLEPCCACTIIDSPSVPQRRASM